MSTQEEVLTMVKELNEEQLQALATFLRVTVKSPSSMAADKERRNQAYLQKLDEGFAQIQNGTCQKHDLIEVEDDGKALV